MSVELLYVAHNRLAYVRETWAALVANTDWAGVHSITVIDDASTDGTQIYLEDQVHHLRDERVSAAFATGRFGGPVAAMNAALDVCEAPLLAKVDSDLVVCPGWLERLLDVAERNPHLDAIGMEPGFVHEPPRNGYVPARWIGGQGLFRTSLFKRHRLRQTERYFGLTEVLRRHAECGWVAPELDVFNLDHLPFDPWRSLAEEYVARGWSRSWGTYGPELAHCWSWWHSVHHPVAA
jgi:GT2 family glycosyltransferase